MNTLCHTKRRNANNRQFPSLILIATKLESVISFGEENRIRATRIDAARAQRSKSLARYWINRLLFEGIAHS
jgi:hypothetical protein